MASHSDTANTLNLLRLPLLCCVCRQQCTITLIRSIREIRVPRYLHMPPNILPHCLVIFQVQEQKIFHCGLDHWWIKISFLLSAIIIIVSFKACCLIRHAATWAVFYREKEIFAATLYPHAAYSLKHEASMPLSYVSSHKSLQHFLCINHHRIIKALETNNFWKKNVADEARLSYS